MFAEDHPAVRTPIVEMELIASKKKTPSSRSRTINVGLNGIIVNRPTTAAITQAGAHLNTGSSTSFGMIVSFCKYFAAVASGNIKPLKPT